MNIGNLKKSKRLNAISLYETKTQVLGGVELTADVRGVCFVLPAKHSNSHSRPIPYADFESALGNLLPWTNGAVETVSIG